ncbi:MAG: ATP-binding protein, partial [Gammaproteobacteria bacterium]|nr:ATP-binding protein [Gammaproteobacteria bacterium]
MRKKSKKPFEIQNTKQIMYAGYAIILCLLLVVTVIFVNSLFKNNQQLNLLSSYFFQQTYIEDMHNAAISRTVSALRMAMEKDAFKQLELQEEMFDSASEFIAARDKFRAKIKKSPQVKATFEKILDDVQLTSGLLKQVVEFSINGQQARAQQIMQEQSVENQRRILKGLQKLKQQEFDKVKSILSNSIGENRKTRNFLIVISVLTIFAILSVAYVMIRFVSKTESTLRNQGLRVRLLYEATSGLNTNWDEQIEQIIRLGCTLLNFKKAFICRYANEKKQCGVEYTTIGVQNQVLEKSEWLNSEFCVEMMAESTNQDSCSVLTSSSYDNQSNSLAIPITVNGRPYGSLNFIREDGYQKTLAELDVDFSNMIANWVGVAIERQQAHQAMEDAIAKANAASKAKSQFVANMSHEIRTPLTAILGFSESLLENDVPKDEYHNAAETIVRSGKHLQQIINDILDLSKIEAGQLVIETIKTDVRDVLDDVGSLMSKRAQSKNISFRIIKHYPLPGIITTDPTRLKQILLNIAGNAIKFTRHGQVTIELTFLFEQKQLRFEVKDTGIGMTPYELSKLFKPFTQAD